MKKILINILTTCVALIAMQCSEQNDVKKQRASKEVELKFNVDGLDQIIKATMIYNESLKKSQLLSDELIEITAKHDKTGRMIHVYTLKSNRMEQSNGRIEWKRLRGYYGYDSGCYYFGTLYVGDNGEELFTPDSTAYNAPICEEGIWA